MFKRLLIFATLLLAVTCVFADEVTIYTNSGVNTWEAVTDPDAGYQTTSNGFTVAFYKGSSTTDPRDPSSDSDHIRVYKSSVLYIAGLNGETITKVVVNCTGSKYCADMTVNDTETATADTDALSITWEGSCTEWSGVTSAQTRVSSVEITYTTDDTTDGTDGDTEEEDDDEGTTLDLTGAGTLESPYTVSDALALINAGSYTSESVYTQGIISTVKEVSTSYGNATYNISDDGSTESELVVYRGYSLDGAKFTSEDEIQVGDTVVVYGALTLYSSTAEITTGSSIAYLGRPASEGGEEDEEGSSDEGYVYQLVTDGSSLSAGDIVTLVNEASGVVIADCAGNYFNYAEATIVQSTLDCADVQTPITLEAAGDGYWRLSTSAGYLYASSTESNYMGLTAEALTDSSDIATIAIAYDEDDATYYATITFQGESERNTIRYNSGTYGRFSCYRSSTTNVLGVQLYQRVEGTMPEVVYEPTGAGTLESPYTVADALALIESSAYTSESVYTQGIISTVSEVSTSYGNATYSISDDGSTDSELVVYRGYSLDGAKFTSEDEIQVGDTVVVYGALTLYYSTAEISTGSSIAYLGRPESEGTEEDDTAYATYAKASELTSGQSYLLVVQDGENTLYGTNHSASYTYGYIYVNTVSGLTDTLSVDASGSYAFVLTASETTEGAYTIQDSYGRYLYQNGTYKSFQLADTNDGYDWTLTANEDGTWTITYAASSYYVQYSTSYSSFGVYADAQDNALLPYLYELVAGATDDTEDDTTEGDDDDSAEGEAYELVTDASSLAAGDVITFGSADYGYGIAEQNENNRNFLTVQLTISDGLLYLAETSSTFTLSLAEDGNWLIQYDATGYYLTSNSESSNYLSTLEEPDGLYSEATISIAEDGNATVVFQGDNERRWLRYNTNGYFSVYAEGGQKDVQIYRKPASDDGEETAISALTTSATAPQGVYTLSGLRLESLDGAAAGVYIIDGKKVLVK